MEIVAELSCNHLGGYDRAVALIDAAKEARADAVKLQCWHPDRIVVKRDYVIDSGQWAGRNLYDLCHEAHTPWDWFPRLFTHARQIGIDCFVSVFDVRALDFLERIHCSRYKIASFEALDLPLVRAVVATGKPVIVSTGMMREKDFPPLLRIVPRDRLTLLKCVSEYPARASSYNLGSVRLLKGFANCAGVSDHTLGAAVPIAAAALRAGMLEKHFTLSRVDGGLDAAFSVEPHELRGIVSQCRDVEAAMIGDRYVNDVSAQSAQFKRSLWVAQPIKAGDVITFEGVVSARPAGGADPDAIDKVIGCRATRDMAPGEPLRLVDIQP